ncbi:response regulator transcription factor [Sphingomonas sp. PAMC 26605]|uniref:response regulator transcription factor n=1 Tax=Sphingomonas sp. PAMC 26605 TaxID=1112214 RepID=UPI0002D8D9E7|nr:response regulator [Sphingomonas sp. PAMC 26605]
MAAYPLFPKEKRLLFGPIASAPVYVVDDDALVRESTQFLLATLGISSRTFADGAGFLDAVEQLPDGCLLVDRVMPGVGGLEIVHALHARQRQMPIILMTAATNTPSRRLADTIGPHTLLEKPFAESALLTALGSGFERLAFGSEQDAANARDVVAQLPPLQTTILRGLIAGLDTPALAERLGLAETRVRRSRVALKARIGARDVHHAIAIGRRAGLPPLPAHDDEKAPSRW